MPFGLLVSIAAFLHLFHFYFCLSENSSELMLFVNLNRHEIKFLVSCILAYIAIPLSSVSGFKNRSYVSILKKAALVLKVACLGYISVNAMISGLFS